MEHVEPIDAAGLADAAAAARARLASPAPATPSPETDLSVLRLPVTEAPEPTAEDRRFARDLGEALTMLGAYAVSIFSPAAAERIATSRMRIGEAASERAAFALSLPGIVKAVGGVLLGAVSDGVAEHLAARRKPAAAVQASSEAVA